MTKPFCQGRHTAYVGLMMAGLCLCLGPLRTWADDFPKRPRGGPPPPASVPPQHIDRAQPPADPSQPTLASDEEDSAAEVLPALDADDRPFAEMVLQRLANEFALVCVVFDDEESKLFHETAIPSGCVSIHPASAAIPAGPGHA